MKKFFTLLFTVGLFTGAFAQSGHRDQARSVVIGQTDHSTFNKGTAPSYNWSKDRDDKIREINREYDMKIAQVQRDRRMNRFEKNRQVRQLEKQRTMELKMASQQFSKYEHGRRW